MMQVNNKLEKEYKRDQVGAYSSFYGVYVPSVSHTDVLAVLCL